MYTGGGKKKTLDAIKNNYIDMYLHCKSTSPETPPWLQCSK